MNTCLNCGHSYNGNFCSNCGQKADVKRITAAVLFEEILHFFTHLEKGFFRTSWNFIARPGSTSLNYLEGQRKKHQKPVSYFLVWTGLYIILHNLVINHYHYQLTEESFVQLNLTEQSNVLLRTHFTVFTIPILLVSAIVTYYVLARPRFNFTEVLALALYAGGTYFMMLFFSDIILGVVFKVNTVSTNVFMWQTILSTFYNFWFSYDIFRRVGLRFFVLRLIIVAFLIALIGLAMLSYLPMLWIYFTR